MIQNYQRTRFNHLPLYINAEMPDWFIPSEKADFILQEGLRNQPLHTIIGSFAQHYSLPVEEAGRIVYKLFNRINSAASTGPYYGRVHHKQLNRLKECWLHVTNQCNMTCKHCLFSSGPNEHSAIPYEDLLHSIHTLYDLGCRIFYFTGGEPFVYPCFTSACNELFRKKDAHIVVLTNGKNIKAFDQWFASLPQDRFHIQLSIDGMEDHHDATRGQGSFRMLEDAITYLQSWRFPLSLSMVVNKENVYDMQSLVDFATQYHIPNIHFMWLFKKGNADNQMFVDPPIIFRELIKAEQKAHQYDIKIDNLDILKSQLYSLPGTKFDLNNAAWESLAIGPNGFIYPSPALIGEEQMKAGHIKDGIEHIWRDSPLFHTIRQTSLASDTRLKNHILKYLTGGSDIDHSFIANGTFVGDDPYQSLYEQAALHLLTDPDTQKRYQEMIHSGFVKRMGERLYECKEDDAAVGFTHSNCVLSLPGKDGYTSVRSFYRDAAGPINTDIVNPYQADEGDTMDYIPETAKDRNYGCGSPVNDISLQEGDTVVDLGSGTGTECFMASREVGREGTVYGIDMTDAMLEVAREAAKSAARELGYENVSFIRGLLEDIPVNSNIADTVISNCVINLSPDKRQTFREILRILKPGGRICIADILTDHDIPLEIKYNEKLRGECIGGAMQEQELYGILEDLGFEHIYVHKRRYYREVKGYPFYSVTYSGYKPSSQTAEKKVIYRGPMPSINLEDGTILYRGLVHSIQVPEHIHFDDQFLVLDNNGEVQNIEQEDRCGCFTAPPPNKDSHQSQSHAAEAEKQDCMVCGEPLIYHEANQERECYYCQKSVPANAECKQGHFVCDDCHSHDAVAFIRSIAKEAAYSDMITMMDAIRNHPSMLMHGPEHHAMIPAIMTSVFKNIAGQITNNDIDTTVDRGATVAGGSCAFMGICGAASGVGSGFAVLLKSTPYKGKERQMVQSIVQEVLKEIAKYSAPRCCQRDCWIALKKASEMSADYLPFQLPADNALICNQQEQNKECIGKACPIGE